MHLLVLFSLAEPPVAAVVSILVLHEVLSAVSTRLPLLLAGFAP